jgi:hypothetical protein
VFELKNYEDDPVLKEMLPYILESEAEDVGIEVDETVETEEAVAI